MGNFIRLGIHNPLCGDCRSLGVLSILRTTVTLRREDFVDDLTFNAFIRQVTPASAKDEGIVDITKVQTAKLFVSWDEDSLQAQPKEL